MREETAEACPGMVLRPGGKARVSLSTRGNLFELLRLSGVCPLEYRGVNGHHDESVFNRTFKIRREPLLLWQCGFFEINKIRLWEATAYPRLTRTRARNILGKIGQPERTALVPHCA